MFNKEPTVILGALSEIVRAIIPTLIIFGILHWTDQQIAQVMLMVGVLVKSLEMVLARSQVVPIQTADRQMEVARSSASDRPLDQIIKEAKESL